MNTQEPSDKQVKPAKCVLTERDLRHMPGIAVTTGVKVGQDYFFAELLGEEMPEKSYIEEYK